MGWQRRIPFGYEMKDGINLPCPQEAEVVREIYATYRQGSSYLSIADALSEQEIRYHKDTPTWNKHMVKRILENKNYLGNEKYPRLISDEAYQTARQRQVQTTAGWAHRPSSIDHIKPKAVCAVCGSPIGHLTGISNRSGNRWWHCSNPDYPTVLRITDSEMEAAVTSLLGKVIQNPKLLLAPTKNQPASQAKYRRMCRQIHRELEQPDFNEQTICSLILCCAAEQYRLCEDVDLLWQSRELQDKLKDYGKVEHFDPALFQQLTSAVLVGGKSDVGLRLVNGKCIRITHKEVVR